MRSIEEYQRVTNDYNAAIAMKRKQADESLPEALDRIARLPTLAARIAEANRKADV